jgi:mono/diheme cytochrome c family protein
MRSSPWLLARGLVLAALLIPPCLAQAPAPAPAAPQTGAPNVAHGQEIFASTCVICHGEDGQGGHGGGAPLAAVTNPAAAIQTITAGRNTMPAFDGVLTPEQIRDVAAYVVERLSEKAK